MNDQLNTVPDEDEPDEFDKLYAEYLALPAEEREKDDREFYEWSLDRIESEESREKLMALVRSYRAAVGRE